MEDIYAINLERRVDRKQNLIDQFKNIDFCNIKIFKAVEHEQGRIGCALSHLSLIKFAKENDMDYIIVVEDDISLNKKEEFKQILSILTKNWYKYDIFNGSPTFWDKRDNVGSIVKTKSFSQDFSFVSDALTTIFMIYTKRSYDKILNDYDPHKSTLAIDQYYARNFMQLCYKNYLCGQIIGYSDLFKYVTDVSGYLRDNEKIFQSLTEKDECFS
jgi:GR25 family glycosyltransferase involved in LPS biosynthesis